MIEKPSQLPAVPATQQTPPHWFDPQQGWPEYESAETEGHWTLKWLRNFAPVGATFSVELFCIDKFTTNSTSPVSRSINYLVGVGTYPPTSCADVDRARDAAYTAEAKIGHESGLFSTPENE